MEDKVLDYRGDPESKQDFYNFLRSKNLLRTGAMYAEEANLQPKPEAADNEALMLGTGSESVPLTAEKVHEYLERDNLPRLARALPVSEGWVQPQPNVLYNVYCSGAGDYNPVGNQAFTLTTSMPLQSSASIPPNAYPVLPAPGPPRKRRSIPEQYHKEEISRTIRQKVDHDQRHPPAQRSPVEQLAPNRPDQASSSRVLNWPSMGSSPNERHYWGQLAPAAGGGYPAMVPQAQAGHQMGSLQRQEQHHWNQLAPAAGGGYPAMVPQAQAGHQMGSLQSQEQHGGGYPAMVPQAQADHQMGSLQSQEQHHWNQLAPAAGGGYPAMVPQAQAGHQMGSLQSQEQHGGGYPAMVPQAQAGHSMGSFRNPMVPQAQGHFRNPPSNVGPSGFRTTVIQPHHNYTYRPPPVVPRPPTPSMKVQTHTQDKVKLNDLLWGKPPRIWKALDEASTSRTSIGSSYCVSYDGMPPLFYNLPQAQAGHPMMVPRPEIGSSSSQQIHFTSAPRNVDPAGFRTAVGEQRQSSASLPPYALPAPPHINMANVRPAPPVLQDPNQQLEAVDPNQQLEAVIPTTAPGSLDHVS